MVSFSELPPEVIAMILQSVNPFPVDGVLAAQLRTNRTFYKYLKPILYAKACLFLLERGRTIEDVQADTSNCIRLQKSLNENKALISMITEYVLPFEGDEPDHDSNTFRGFRRLFSQITACTSLHLALFDGFHLPTAEETSTLQSVTELTISGSVPGEESIYQTLYISAGELDAWTMHMPRLTSLYFTHLDGVCVTGLARLPRTLVSLELLGDQVWKAFTPQDLHSILQNLPALRHFLLSEMCAPVEQVATVLKDSLASGVTSFGIGYIYIDEDEEPDDIGGLLWEKQLALFLQRPYTSLTFYNVKDMIACIDTLAKSPLAASLRNLHFRTPLSSNILIQTSDSNMGLNSINQLMDRNIFANLARLTGRRVRDQMEKLDAWTQFRDQAGWNGVHLEVEEWQEGR